jgi:hypothetical protein
MGIWCFTQGLACRMATHRHWVHRHSHRHWVHILPQLLRILNLGLSSESIMNQLKIFLLQEKE